jgi:GGDEF domain-containing protein
VPVKGAKVDPTSDSMTADLPPGEEARDLWEAALPYLSQALAGRETAFLDALESAGRGAGLTQQVPVNELLDAYSRGSEALRVRLLEGGDEAEPAARRLLAMERAALLRIAAGYARGLGETIERLRRVVEESSPVDVDSGAMKPGELGGLLSLEVERCQRMDLPLGLLELAVDRHEAQRRAAGRPSHSDLHHIGDCLRENLRRYDSVGLTDEGAFVLVLPDISRRGLEGAAERLRREIGSCGGHGERPELTFALAHYDLVDANAQEMLAVLGSSMHHAREAHQPIAWA